MSNTLKFQLVAPSVWHGALDDALALVEAGERPFVRAGLAALQRRHVGITPGLVAEVVPALTRPYHVAVLGGAWGAVYRRLLKALQGDDHRQRGRGGAVPSLTLSAAPAYFLFRIAAPVVQSACERLGCVCLLCADGAGTSVSADGYAVYARELAEAIEELAYDEAEEADLFWQVRALTISSFARGHGEAAEVSPLPAADPLAAGLLLRLIPLHKPGQAETRRSRQLTEIKRQRDLKWREEGFDGIHLTHSDEDLPHRLTTEYLYDRLTQADRILNTGFLALEREPRRIRLRDVLMVAYLPGAFWQTMQGDFLRACWFDFTMRAALILRQNGLLKSEFRWIEADGAGRSRTVTMHLEELPEAPPTLESTRRKFVRRQFCASLRWLPRILDMASGAFHTGRAAVSRPDGQRSQPLQGEVSRWQASEEWIATLWAAQVEAPPAAEEAAGDTQAPLCAEEFVYTFHLPFLPVRGEAPEQGEALQLRARLAGRLHALRPYRGTLCLTCAPLDLAQLDGWRLSARTHTPAQLLTATAIAEKPTPAGLAGAVVDGWLTQFLKETPRG